MRFAAACAAFLTSSAIGLMIAEQSSKRVTLLSDMERIVRMLELAGMTTGDSIIKLLQSIEGELNAPSKELVALYVGFADGETSRDAWSAATDMVIQKNRFALGVTADDIMLIREIGGAMGGMLRGRQSALGYIADRLSKRREEALLERERKRPLAIKLGLLFGAGLAIFLI